MEKPFPDLKTDNLKEAQLWLADIDASEIFTAFLLLQL